MNDPYSVLGVSSGASDNEVKKAYHDLARKYHPDNYHDNPLADLAQEKMKEVNEAYNSILRMREGGGSSRAGRGFTGSSGGSAEGARVRAAINAGNIQLAEELLKAFPERTAEWYFLMGSVYVRKGWFDEAARHFDRACEMDPGNGEYSQARNQMRGGAYRSGGYGSPYGRPYGPGRGMSGCDCCTTMLCADCCCESMGGDLCCCC